ncbi:MAG TPA: NAD-dependent epimerase/dehydratase family protein [Myxococcota bacterium]|nr:NAD-dependent epimerase/dehydratase family protein [Myxococcota bacterium]
MNPRSGRVLVTGGAGFIGSTLVERLLGDGRDITVLDSFDPYYPEAEKEANLRAALQSSQFELKRGDIRDPKLLEQVLSRGAFSAIVHLAALAGVRPSLERPAHYADVNVRGTACVLEAAVRAGVTHVVFASSSSVYGERSEGPFRETDPVDRPISPYAATKRACELIAHSFHHAHGITVTCARIFTAYGPRQRPDLAIRRFAERMLAGKPVPVFGDGSTVRDFTYVHDLVDGLVRALDRPLGFSILNFGAGRMCSVLEVVRLLEKALGITAKIEWLPRQIGDVSRTFADISAAREVLGYAPKTPLDVGIEHFAQWLKERK